jgi:cAMP phosphodiesterase
MPFFNEKGETGDEFAIALMVFMSIILILLIIIVAEEDKYYRKTIIGENNILDEHQVQIFNEEVDPKVNQMAMSLIEGVMKGMIMGFMFSSTVSTAIFRGIVFSLVGGISTGVKILSVNKRIIKLF